MRILVALSASALVLLSGCDRGAPEDAAAPANATNPQTPADAGEATIDRYENIKGRIIAVPVEGDFMNDRLSIHHEALPKFKKKDGGLGMNEMTMDFPIGEGVSLAGFEPGDPVEFDFEVDWSQPGYWLAGIRKLPADTKLPLTAEQGHDHAGHDHDHDHSGHDHDHDHGSGGG